MALKKVVDTAKSTYLTKRFEDHEGNQYEDDAANSIVSWFRFTDTPSNLVSTGPSIVYEGDTISAGSFVIGQRYRIVSGGSSATDFTLIGASDSNVGTVFVATGAGTGNGNGTAKETPVVAKQRIGEVEYPAATFSDGINLNAQSTSSKFSFSTISEEVTLSEIASGGIAGTDLPFTFSMWVKITGESSDEMLFAKKAQSNRAEYVAFYDSAGPRDGKFKIILYGANSNTNTLQVITRSSTPNVVGNWTHIAYTYAGGTATASGAYAEQAIKIYVNGDLQQTTGAAAGTYLSTAPYRDQPLYIGATYNGTFELDGDMAEFAVWKSNLSDENIKAIYNTSKSRFTRNQTVSGFINHSPRIQSIENVNYHNVHGKFDDTRTVDFIDPRQEATVRFSRVPSDGLPSGHTISITDAGSSVKKVFEFQRGVILTFDDTASVVNAGGFIVGKKYKIVSTGSSSSSTDFTLIGSSNNTVGTVFTATGPGTGTGTARPENVEVNIRGIRTTAGAAKRFVDAVNSETNPGSWTFHAEQINSNEVVIRRGKIDSAGACTISTNAPERFIEVTGGFKVKPQPATVYPSLEISDSSHLEERKSYGGSYRSDIELIRPVSRISHENPRATQPIMPYDESSAHAAFGFEEGLEGVSPNRDIASEFYVSGSSVVASPSSVRNKKRIVIDMPITTSSHILNMGYYNFSLQRWEEIGKATRTLSDIGLVYDSGDTLTDSSFAVDTRATLDTPTFESRTNTSTEDRLTITSRFLNNLPIGFTPSTGLEVFDTSIMYSGDTFIQRFNVTGSFNNRNLPGEDGKILGVGALAEPTNIFGFPMNARFHATGSQSIDIGKHIDKPFVLEKVVFEVDMRNDPVRVRLPGDTAAGEDISPNGDTTGVPCLAYLQFSDVGFSTGPQPIVHDDASGNHPSVTLTSSDGTTLTYNGGGSNNYSIRQYDSRRNVGALNDFIAAIVHSAGHAGKIIAFHDHDTTVGSQCNSPILMQSEPGRAGNTQVAVVRNSAPVHVSSEVANDFRSQDSNKMRFRGGGTELYKPLKSDSSEVDVDCCNFFILNQRKGATGQELSNLPEINIGEGDSRKTTLDSLPAGNSVAEFISPQGSIPSEVKLTSVDDTPTVKVETMRDLVTYAKVSLTHTGFDATQLATNAKDIRKDSDLNVQAQNETMPWGSPDSITFTFGDSTVYRHHQVRDAGGNLVPNTPPGDRSGAFLGITSSDGTTKVYVFDGLNANAGANATGQRQTAPYSGVIVNTRPATLPVDGATETVEITAAEVAAEVASALTHSNGHGNKLTVTQSGASVTVTGIVAFTQYVPTEDNKTRRPNPYLSAKTSETGGTRYKISAPCRASHIQDNSAGRHSGAPALVKLSTGPFGINGNTVQASNTELSMPMYIQASCANLGRTLADIQSGRSPTSENPSLEVLYKMRGNENADLQITAYEVDKNSTPYTFLPGDQLIVGVQTPVAYDLTAYRGVEATGYGSGVESRDGIDSASRAVSFPKGIGKIILYGYEPQHEKERFGEHDSSSTGNSNFFSEGVGSIAVRDQYETHPRMTYFKSSIDEIVTGSMLANLNDVGDGFSTERQQLHRSVVGRNSEGTQGKVGSLLRARKLEDAGERYYDSMLPDLRVLMRKDNVTGLDITPNLGSSMLVLGARGSDRVYKSKVATSASSSKLIWDNWFSSFPFEPRYSPNQTARQNSINKNVFSAVQTGEGKGTTVGNTINQVAIALFDQESDLQVRGNSGNSYISNGILDNPLETESTKRLTSAGTAATMFVNSPTLTDSEVYVSWRSLDVAATGSIQFLSVFDTAADSIELNNKSFTLPFYAPGSSTVSSTQNFIFAVSDSSTRSTYNSGVTLASNQNAGIRITYDENTIVSSLAKTLLQIPSGSGIEAPGLKLLLDETGLSATGKPPVRPDFSGLSHVNKGSTSAFGTETSSLLHHMWHTGSATTINKTLAAGEIKNGSTGEVLGTVPAGTNVVIFADADGDEANRRFGFDRLVNTYSTSMEGFDNSNIASLTNNFQQVILDYKHLKGPAASIVASMTDAPDANEDLFASLGYGLTGSITFNYDATSFPTNVTGEVKLTSTEGKERTYEFLPSSTANPSDGTTPVSSGDMIGQNIAVAIDPSQNGQARMASFKSAIEHANGHGTGHFTFIHEPDGSDNNAGKVILGQTVAGSRGNTGVTNSIASLSLPAIFTGGANKRNSKTTVINHIMSGEPVTDTYSYFGNAIWGQKIDHSQGSQNADPSHTPGSQTGAFVRNQHRVGHSIKIPIGSAGSGTTFWGWNPDHRIETENGGVSKTPVSGIDNGSSTLYNFDSTSRDVIRFTVEVEIAGDSSETGGAEGADSTTTLTKHYQFFPGGRNKTGTEVHGMLNYGNLHSMSGITLSDNPDWWQDSTGPRQYNSNPVGTYVLRTLAPERVSVVNQALPIEANTKTAQTFEAKEVDNLFGGMYTTEINKMLSAEGLARAITVVGRYDRHTFDNHVVTGTDTAGEKYHFVALESFEGGQWYLNIYFVSYAQDGIAPNPPKPTFVQAIVNGSEVNASDIKVGPGAAKDFYATIGQTGATAIDSYAMCDAKITADLDPANKFLKYDSADNNESKKKNSIVSVNISGKTSMDEVFSEISTAINTTKSDNSTSAGFPGNGIISAVHDSANNTLTIMYDQPNISSRYQDILNKVLFPVPNTRVDTINLRPDMNSHTHRVIEFSGLDYSTPADVPDLAGTEIKNKFDILKRELSRQGITWNLSPAVQVDKSVKLTQGAKLAAGNAQIQHNLPTSLVEVKGFGGGQAAVYGDGDITGEPLGVGPDDFSSITIEVKALPTNGQTLTFAIGNVNYSAQFDSSVTPSNSTANKIGISGVTRTTEVAESMVTSLNLAFVPHTTKDSYFADQIEKGKVYTIDDPGNTDFKSGGAAANIGGTVFTSNKNGLTGTGTVYQTKVRASFTTGSLSRAQKEAFANSLHATAFAVGSDEDDAFHGNSGGGPTQKLKFKTAGDATNFINAFPQGTVLRLNDVNTGGTNAEIVVNAISSDEVTYSASELLRNSNLGIGDRIVLPLRNVNSVTPSETFVTEIDTAQSVLLQVANSLHIDGASPVLAGTSVSSNKIVVGKDWSGSDLLRISGALIKRKSLQQGVAQNDPEDIETVQFATVIAPQSGESQEQPLVLNQSEIQYDLGNTFNANLDYYQKILFGSGDGPAKSPKFKLNEPEKLSVDVKTTTYSAVSHGPDASCSKVGGPFGFDENFTGTGVAFAPILSVGDSPAASGGFVGANSIGTIAIRGRPGSTGNQVYSVQNYSQFVFQDPMDDLVISLTNTQGSDFQLVLNKDLDAARQLKVIAALDITGVADGHTLQFTLNAAAGGTDLNDGVTTIKFYNTLPGTGTPNEIAVKIGADDDDTRTNLRIAINGGSLASDRIVWAPSGTGQRFRGASSGDNYDVGVEGLRCVIQPSQLIELFIRKPGDHTLILANGGGGNVALVTSINKDTPTNFHASAAITGGTETEVSVNPGFPHVAQIGIRVDSNNNSAANEETKNQFAAIIASGINNSLTQALTNTNSDGITTTFGIQAVSIEKANSYGKTDLGSAIGLAKINLKQLVKGDGGNTAIGISLGGPNNNGHVAFETTAFAGTSDSPLIFSAGTTRRLDLNKTIPAGSSVFVRYSMATFDSGANTAPSGGTYPSIQTPDGHPFENADRDDSPVSLKVSTNNGASYVDAHTVFTLVKDNATMSDSNMVTILNDTDTLSDRFIEGLSTDHLVEGIQTSFDSDSNNLYPLITFTVNTDTLLRFEQNSWSQSRATKYDHFLFRYLTVHVVPPTSLGEGGVINESGVPVSSRGNFGQHALASEVEIRGAKYGLISPVKLNTSAIFRAGSFGQHRDMLEQRLFSRTFNGNQVTEGTVEVSFQERISKRVVSPEETNSANLNVFCTSSLPYYDGEAKDRATSQPDLLDEVEIDIQV